MRGRRFGAPAHHHVHRRVNILGIETSCDDTSAAVLADGSVLSNVVSSQDDLHASYGGVVPELAARRHLEIIQSVVARAIDASGKSFEEVDAIAVTRGPGLVGSLLIGLSAAQGLALRLGVPVMGVSHIEGHVLSPLLESSVACPFLALLVSGGHSALYLVRDIGDYLEVASTRDDSAGEAFDKGAKMLGLGYPGGRVIDALAVGGKVDAVALPRARVRSDDMALSFSGLKTALWDYLRKQPSGVSLRDVCASFQEAIIDVLLDRCLKAMDRFGVSRIAITGGVSANSRLRARAATAVAARGGVLVLPSLALCTDNAAMIAAVATFRERHGLPHHPLVAASRLPLGSSLV